MTTDLSKLRHDLCTPLNQVLGYSEMLQEDVKDQPAITLQLQEIFSGGKRFLSLISQVLAVEGATGDFIRGELQGPLDDIITRSSQLVTAAKNAGLNDLLKDLQKIVKAAGELDVMVKNAQVRPPQKQTSDDSAFFFRSPTSKAQAQQPAGPCGKILVVDDLEMNRDVLGRRLQRQGHKVTMVESGQKALETLAASEFDLVLLDIIMPEMDGYQVLQTLKTDPNLRHLPVIMLSALDQIESVIRCIEMGAEDYLPKPFNPILLRARVGACLERKHLRELVGKK